MRILAIRGQNLASLARTFEVDFAAGPLAGAGLFAIIGPVGAGKSTLLDALCLALFDRTPRLSGHGGVLVGDEGSDERDWLRANDPRLVLRRDATAGHAEADFIGRDGVRYRARWSVRRARSGSRRLQHQELLLSDLDHGVVVAKNTRSEVLAAIQQRLGLDFAQFCRSVLLAQGDFAAFLRAKADERAKLLEALTGAEVYRRLSRAAHERARAAQEEVGKLNAQFEAQAPLAEGVRTSLERTAVQLAGEVEVGKIAVELAGRYVAWHQQAESHRQRESEATVELQAAMAAEARAAARRELLARRQRALAAAGRFAVASEAQAELACAQDVARTAVAAAQQQQRALADASAAFVAALQRELGETAAAGALGTLPLLVDLASWEPLLLQWQQVDARAVVVAETLPQHEALAAAAAAQAATACAAVARQAAACDEAQRAVAAAQRVAEDPELQQVPARRRELDAARALVQTQQQAVDAWWRAATAAASADAEVAAWRVRAAAAAAATAAGEAAAATAVAGVEQQREQVEQLRTRAGLAGLRSRLVPGEPCPLCGSAEHPAAGHDDGGALPQAQQALTAATKELDAVRQRAAEAAAAHSQARHELQRWTPAAAAAQQDLQAARAHAVQTGPAAPDADVARELLRAAHDELRAGEQQLAALGERATAANQAFQRALRTLAAATTKLQDAEQKAQQAGREREQHAGAHTGLQREAAALAVRVDELRAALAPACAGLPDGAASLARLGARRLPRLRELCAARNECAAAERRAASAASTAAAAQQDEQRAAAGAAQAAAALARALELAGVQLDDVAAALAAGAQGLAEEADALQALATEVTHCRSVVQERAKQRQQHERRERATLDAVDAARAQREAQASEAAAAAHLADVRAQLHADDLLRRQRNELAPRLEAATAELRTWAMLDELIGSSTGDTFAVFAQGLTLDLLLTEANRRLAELARRYRLHRNAGGELDFFVIDLDLGGSARSLQTLSGGETFLVSLALALALATLAAPKARVETLFLDEGFGTLDAQSLEVALGALDSLQAGGCQVGIISHVDGIAERIGAQVVVQPEGAGQSRVFARER